jgi:slime mold repeat-containing protein
MPQAGADVRRLKAAALIGMVLSVLGARPALALHKESPPEYRITAGGTHAHPPGRSWGNYFAFTSSQDLAHTGNTRQEIFVFNMAFFDCFQGTTFATTPCPPPLPNGAPQPFMIQATNGPGEPDDPSIALPFDANGDGVIDNQWLAFDALGTFLGGTGAQASHRQIFVKNMITGEIRQVTFGGDGDSVRPVVNSLGGVIVFESNARLLPTSPSPAGVTQVYVYETKARLLKQITFGAGPSTRPIPNQDGGLIAFQSTANLLGSGADTGISQIFWTQYSKTTHTSVLQQLTHGNGPSEHPYISEDNSFVVFDSSATDLPQTLGSVGTSIFMSTALKDPNIQPPAIIQVTVPGPFGDCTYPFVDAGSVGDHLGFICTGDPLQNGTLGNRVFVIERSTNVLMQITGAGDVQPPIGGTIGSWFVTLSTTSAMTGPESCGYQLFVVDYLGTQQPGHDPKWIPATQIGQLPPDVTGAPSPTGTTNLIGARNFVMLPGDSTMGSDVGVTTRDGTMIGAVNPIGTQGLRLVIGAADEFHHQASIGIPKSRLNFPPFPLGSYGMLCIAAAADGAGTIDCDGADPGGDVLISQDHVSDDVDPACVSGCREGTSCQVGLLGPHRIPCALCVTGSCNGGPNVGQACANDAACAQNGCVDGSIGVCNGPVLGTRQGTYQPGGMQLSIPLTVSLSINPGASDGTYCTADDQYAFKGARATLHLTTGTAALAITGADDDPNATLMYSETGAPFNCASLQAGVMAGARLVGGFPLLDVPGIPALRDAIVSLRLVPRPDDQSCLLGCATDLDCNDGNPCNGAESCLAGVCVPGTPFVCDDGDPCNGVETCDPTTGACVNGTPCDDGNPCNGVETCDLTTGCHLGTPIACGDGLACDGTETCDPNSAACVPGTPPNCDDGNPCTADSCVEPTGCVHVPTTGPCDDGNACTSNDFCQGGVCVGTPVSCDDGKVCNGFETCDPLSGACVAGTPPICDDGNPCTSDSCDDVLGCLYTNNTGPCDDGNLCTTNDTCAGGTCVGTPVTCTGGDPCTGLNACDPLTGTCQPGTPLDCDDGNPCTDDTCDVTLGCLHTNNTGPCDDGNACTTGDACLGGICGGTAVTCSDGDACNGIETCDPALGCVPGTPVVCDDGDPCTADSCDPATGLCSFTPNGLCLVARLQGMLVNPGAFLPHTVRARLILRLNQIKGLIERAVKNPARARRLYARAYRAIVRLERALNAAMARGVLDADLGRQLMTIADQLKGAMQGLTAFRAR